MNTPAKDFYRRHQRRLDSQVVPMPNRVAAVEARLVDHRELWRDWKRARTDEALEDLAVRAREAGLVDLEARALERLAVRRARGDWLADNRRPLPGGAYSNLRKA